MLEVLDRAAETTPPAAVADRHWLELRFRGAAPPPTGTWTLRLAADQWLPGAPAGGDADFLTWRHSAEWVLSVDLLWVAQLGLVAPPAAVFEQDRLWLGTHGGGLDLRRGWFERADEAGLHFAGEAGSRVFPWAEVQALQLVAEQVTARADRHWLVLHGGGRLRGQVLGLEDGRLRWRTAWGPESWVPLSVVAAVRNRAPALRLLGEEEPLRAAARSGAEAATVIDWSPKRGRSVEGRPLRVAGAEYATGFGTAAPSELVFQVAEPCRFHAKVGVDDETVGFRLRRPVRFRVLLGARELAVATAEPGAPAATLETWIPAAGELRLLSESLDAVQAGAHGDWLDPVLLPGRAPAPD